MTASVEDVGKHVVGMLDKSMHGEQSCCLKIVHIQVQDPGKRSQDHIALVSTADLSRVVRGAAAVEAWFPMKVSDKGELTPELCYHMYVPFVDRFLRVVSYRDPICVAYVRSVYKTLHTQNRQDAEAFLQAFGLQHSWEDHHYTTFRDEAGVRSDE